jgi:dolichol-phosphate mannosyltransferase
MVIFYFFAALFWNSKVLGMHVPGWSSIIIAIFFFGGMTLLSLGIIAEYIFRIYEEVKNRPPYIVMKK